MVIGLNENKFDGMGNIYAKFRPNYPQVFIDYLFANFGITNDSIFADIGAGTGILTKQLLEKKVKVYAVEPNDDMRKVAEANLSSFSNFILVNGTAENTTLADNSIDIITVAQAFHWFDKQKFKAECQRILKPLGKVVLVWNSRDSASDLVMQNDLINRKYCPDFKGFSGNRRGKSSEEDFSDFFSGKYIEKIFDNPLKFTEQSFIGRNLSASYALKEFDTHYNSYVHELKKLFDKYSKNGTLIMPNLTRCYIGMV